MKIRLSKACCAAASLVLFVTACGSSAPTPEVAAADPAPAAEPTTAPVVVDEAAEAPQSAPDQADEVASDAPAPTATPVPVAAAATEVPEPAPEAVTLSLPAVQVVDLATDEMADLASFSRPGATLVWFWAPH